MSKMRKINARLHMRSRSTRRMPMLRRLRQRRRPTLILFGCRVHRYGLVGRYAGGVRVCMCVARRYRMLLVLLPLGARPRPPPGFPALRWRLAFAPVGLPCAPDRVVHSPLPFVAACEVTFFLGVFARLLYERGLPRCLWRFGGCLMALGLSTMGYSVRCQLVRSRVVI